MEALRSRQQVGAAMLQIARQRDYINLGAHKIRRSIRAVMRRALEKCKLAFPLHPQRQEELPAAQA
jgi:hypothetical protein